MLTRLLSCLLLVCASAWAQQSTAQINGVVRDAAGLSVPGAEIKATQTATGLVRTAVTGQDGAYTLTSLPIGPYLLEFSKNGFTKYIQSGVQLRGDRNP